MNKYICFIFGHKYFLAQKLTDTAKRVCCERCSKSFAMEDELKLILDWDADFHEMYEAYGVKIRYLAFEFSK